jgi:LEA14-like dessication related protein
VLVSTGIVNDGIIVVGGASMSEADIVDPVAVFPDKGPFAIRLVKQDITIDSVQLGEGLKYGEGRELVDDGETPVFFRVNGIDTNDNQSDFLGSWIASPGQ